MNLELTVRDKYTYLATFDEIDKLDIEQLCIIEQYNDTTGEIQILLSAEIVQKQLMGSAVTRDDFLYAIELSCFKRAESFALWYLSSRDYSVYQIKEKLSGKYVPQVIDYVTEKLVRNNWLNDYKFAQRKIEYLINQKHCSIKEIKSNLAFKYKISREIVDELIEEYNIDETAQIDYFLKTKYRNKLNDEIAINKTMSSLMRKGYKYNQIKECLKQINI